MGMSLPIEPGALEPTGPESKGAAPRCVKKGLRDRNSPRCTLSQNGYGAYEGWASMASAPRGRCPLRCSPKPKTHSLETGGAKKTQPRGKGPHTKIPPDKEDFQVMKTSPCQASWK
jgi:hypothetical protein